MSEIDFGPPLRSIVMEVTAREVAVLAARPVTFR